MFINPAAINAALFFMGYPVTEPIADKRAAILDLMQVFANEERQLELEKAAPGHVDITNEIFEKWFTDLYKPEEPDFASGFNQDELVDIAEFSHYIDDRRQQLPDSHGTIRTWLSNTVWREIMQKANRTLERINK